MVFHFLVFVEDIAETSLCMDHVYTKNFRLKFTYDSKKWVQKRVKAPVAATPSVASLEQTLLIHIAHPEQLYWSLEMQKSQYPHVWFRW